MENAIGKFPTINRTTQPLPVVIRENDENSLNGKHSYDMSTQSLPHIDNITHFQKIVLVNSSKRSNREEHPLHQIILPLVKTGWENRFNLICSDLSDESKGSLSIRKLESFFKKETYESLKSLITIADLNRDRLSDMLKTAKNAADMFEATSDFCSVISNQCLERLAIKLISDSTLTPLTDKEKSKVSNTILTHSTTCLLAYLSTNRVPH
jgi:hypothetical protein